MKTAAKLFAEKGFGGVGTAEISSATGCGKGALYHHITSKEVLLLDIMVGYLVDLLEDSRVMVRDTPDISDRIHKMSLRLIQAVVEDKAEMTVCFREVHALEIKKRRIVLRLHGDYFRLWEGVMNEARDEGKLRAIDADELKGLLGMYFYSFLWLGPDRIGDVETLAAKFANLVLRASRLD